LYFVFGRWFTALLRRHPLTLDGLSDERFALARSAPPDACCACTHYLVFKEPETQPAVTASHAPPVQVRDPTDRSSLTGFRGTFSGY
jgi:hypothetical protein